MCFLRARLQYSACVMFLAKKVKVYRCVGSIRIAIIKQLLNRNKLILNFEYPYSVQKKKQSQFLYFQNIANKYKHALVLIIYR